MSRPQGIHPAYRPLQFGVKSVLLQRDGATSFVRADQSLAPYARRMTDRLIHWATAEPDRVFLARRRSSQVAGDASWLELRYGHAMENARSIAQALIDRRLGADRPVAILSSNDLEHAQLALGCMMAGVPYCPVSPAYSLISKDFAKLRHVIRTLTPGLVFASDGKLYDAAVRAAVEGDVEVVYVTAPTRADSRYTTFDALRETIATPAVDQAIDATGPETIVKFLFTSGSTKLPKAVINTHRMLCANQQQARQSIPVLSLEPPVLVDWLPWSHTFGGNYCFGLVLYNGGTMYIDEGKPAPGGMAETLRNLREIAPTLYFNVPAGFDAIAAAMRSDEQLRKSLLSRVKMFLYAGAGLSQKVWDTLQEIQESEIGQRIVMTTSLGMTESAPFALFPNTHDISAGDVGLPAPGLELKLAPVNGKVELRYRGPNITPGYWRSDDATREAFDEEGYFCTGDAVAWIDENDPNRGLRFDGRIAEDFKLATGTFVSVGPLRSRVIAAGAPYIQDVVLTGMNLKEIGALIFPTASVRSLAGLLPDAPMLAAVESAPVREHFQKVLELLASSATGSANRIAIMQILHEPPSIDTGEITDKGSINQNAVLKQRAAIVEAMHAGMLGSALTLKRGPYED